MARACAVIMFFQVAQLMDDHVLDALLRGDDQIRVQQDASRWRATAPAVLHAADFERLCGNAVAFVFGHHHN